MYMHIHMMYICLSVQLTACMCTPVDQTDGPEGLSYQVSEWGSQWNQGSLVLYCNAVVSKWGSQWNQGSLVLYCNAVVSKWGSQWNQGSLVLYCNAVVSDCTCTDVYNIFNNDNLIIYNLFVLCSLLDNLGLQWNLRIKDTLGPTTLSFVERLSSSRRFK